jgi:hypothetical protein
MAALSVDCLPSQDTEIMEVCNVLSFRHRTFKSAGNGIRFTDRNSYADPLAVGNDRSGAASIGVVDLPPYETEKKHGSQAVMGNECV